jgi:predicted P-loop ATPase
MNDEMGGKSKHDEKLLKELTSKSVFSLRAPYGRHNEDFKRLAILCGTSNEVDIMQDPTGNTRIFPVEVTTIDHELYNSIDKDELFMECYRLYESGFEWRLTKEEIDKLQGLSKNYEGINFERECIMEHFLPNTELGIVEMLTATQIKEYIEKNSEQQIRNMKYFGRELKSIFGKPIQKRGVGYLYFVIKKNSANSVTATGEQSFPTFPSTIKDKDDLPF